MIGKNNHYLRDTKDGTKVESYSIKKFKVGAASVVIGASIFLGAGAVAQASEEVSNNTTADNTTNAGAKENVPTTPVATAQPVAKETTKEDVAAGLAAKLGGETAKEVKALDKTKLENYISEIEAKLADGTYANKTEESVAVLKADLEAAKATLANATTQDEITKVYSKLVTTVNTKLKAKPVEKKETPAVDTTNGKETVGKKAENTEKKSDSNSIENTGSHDSRNGKEIDKDNAFRTEATAATHPEFTKTVGDITYSVEFSDDKLKEIYVYNKEEANVEFKIKSATNKVNYVETTKGSNQKFREVDSTTLTDDYGYYFKKITTDTDTPLTIAMTGQPNDFIMSNKNYTKTEAQNFAMGDRYLRIAAKDGSTMSTTGSGADADGYFKIVLKSQTYKYSIQQPALDGDKIGVNDINNLTPADIEKIKNQINIEYSKTSTDARLASKKGTALENKSDVVKNIEISGGNITVTYKDDSTDTATISSVVRTNQAPTVEIPYSVDGKKDVYVYANEDINLSIKYTDDSGKIASAIVNGGGNQPLAVKDAANNILDNEYDMTISKITEETVAKTDNPAVITIGGKVTKDAATRYPKLSPDKFPKGETDEYRLATRYATATDKDGKSIENTAQGNTYASDPGSFTIVLKSQAKKYAISDVAGADKVSVTNPAAVTDDEFNAIKEKVKIEFSKTNEDKNLADKKGQPVDNQTERIESITREGNNVVVTYKDGSKDTKPLADFVNVAPKVALPYSNEANKQIYVYTGENTDLTFKGTDENEVKDLYLRGPGDVSWNNTAGYGFTTGKVENGAVTGEGSVSEDKRTATIKMTGVTNLNAGQQWTSYIVSKDNDGKLSNTDYRALDKDPNARQKPGYVQFIVKNQTSKYDIATPTEKVAVTDPANVTDADLDKIKEKLQLEYNKKNDDANISKDSPVTDKDSKIKSLTKDNAGNLVVTYKDGSTDTKPLSDFVTLDKQPAIDAVNTAATEKIAAINSTPNATDEEKAAAIAKVNADKEKALTAINGATAKNALDTAKESGTTAIAADNPVVAKKDAAKKAIEAARKAKEDAIKADTNLSEAEKTAAIAKANEAATAATAKVDVATTDTAVDSAQTEATTAIGKVNPVAKENAKEAIANTLTTKNNEIDKRTDLTDAEKKAAKDEAQKLADAELAKINAQPDNAETPEKATEAQTAVDTAKTAGTGAVEAVTPVAKAEAKKAIADALKAKEAEIAGRNDLTNEEKEAAKAEAKKLADAQLAEIAKQPDVAATPEGAATAQTAVDGAKDKGVADVTAVNPAAAKKPEAKKAIDEALKAKVATIDAREDLTPAEKQTAKDKAAEEAEKAKVAIDVATTDAEVDKAKDAGTGEVAKVNPVAKTKAKDEIAKELAKKEEAIDARTDLTDKEKEAAKEDAKAKAKAATDAINAQPDNAETPEAAATAQTAVNGAKDKGVADVKAVNPVAKEAAKKAIADELAKKEEAIDGRNDLTDEEKAAAKKEAQAKAKEATDAIDAQPSNAETPEKAAEAQTAVNGAKDKGVADVTAVNPEAKAKPEAKKAIDEALKAKEAAIDARTDLTDDEKKAAKDLAKEAADKAKEAIDAATTNDAVDKAKEAGTGEIAKVNPVAKEAAKKAIADELAKKEKEIDGRTDLTDEEKAAAKKDAQNKAKEATDAINAQPNNAETPEKAAEAQTAVDGAKDKGEEAVKAVNPEAKTKPEAKKAIDDKLAKQLEDIANTPDATDEEKKVAVDAAKALADEAKKEIDNAKKDADVKKLQDEAKKEIEKSVPVVEDKPNARKAIEDEAKAKKEAIDARTDLTPKAKEDLKAEVDAIADQAKKAVDKATSATDVDKIEEADKAAIKAVGEVKEPVDKTLVKDPANLTDAEKAKLLEEVKKVNPTAKEVKYDEDGNIEVTTQNGDKGTIKPADIVKTEADLDNGKGGNDINKPIDKVIVKDPANLTDAEKAKIVDEVKAVNPNAIVTIDDKGTVTVSTPDGETAAIPATELVRTKEDTTKPDAGNSKVVKPADKVVGEATDPATQAKVEEKLKDLNPTAKSVKFDEKGNATVTLNDGTTATIPAKDLFKSPEEAAQPNAGNDIVKPADKTVAANPEELTDAEKKAIEDKVRAVNPGATVVVDDKGNATVTTPEGKTAVIPATNLVKTFADSTEKGKDNVNIPADKTVVANPEKLTDAEKKAIDDKVKAVNPGATVVVDDKGNATVTTPEGKAVVISATDLVKTSEDTTKPNAGNDIVKPANKVLVKDPAKLTDLEKKAIENSVVAVNPGAYVTVDDNGNVVVTTRDGKTAVIPVSEVTRTEEDATKANAGNDVNIPSAKTVVADPEKLTDAEKKAIEDKVKAVNPGATVVVDDKGNATVTTPEGKTAVIPAKDLTKKAEDATKVNAGNDVNTPAAKTVVENPEKLTDAEKKAIEDKVKAVNPGATVVVDDKGNATVTTPEGKTAVISATDLVIPAENLPKEATNAKVKTPAIRTLVGDKENLTDVEKAAVKKAIEDVNPGAKVVVDDKGNATVTLPDGSTATIAKEQLVKDKEDAKAKNAGDNLEFDYSKVTVTDIKNITPEEKAKFQFMILGAITDVEEFDISTLEKTTDAEGNTVYTSKDGKVKITIDKDGNATIEKDSKKELAITIDKDGNVTIVTKDGKVLAIPTADAFKEKATDASTEGRINTPANRVLVTDKENLTPEELAMIKESVGAVNPGATVEVDAKGNVTVTTKDGKSATISVDQLVKTLVDVVRENDGNNINLNFEKQEVTDLTNLTNEDKAAAKAKILAVNPNAADVIFDAKGNATVVLKDGKAYTILAKDIFSQKGEVAPSERNNNGAANSNAQGVNSKLGQRLANTGTTETNTGLAGLGLGILGGLLAAARRRKNDKN